MREALRVVHVFVSRQATVHRLSQQVRERQLRVLAPRVGQVLVYEFTESQPLIQFPHEKQATVRSDTRPLEIDFQRSIEQRAEMAGFVSHPLGVYLQSGLIALKPA